MQYRLIKQYLEVLTREQTLVIESGHPLGLFKSKPEAPRVIITNALMVGLYDNQKDWHTAMQMGVANYGQMTAGGWMYIGPQGIVHGTFNTLLNAGRLKPVSYTHLDVYKRQGRGIDGCFRFRIAFFFFI